MSAAPRPILSLNKRDDADLIEEPLVMLDRFEVLIPCRRFQVTYKVAEKGGVSVTSEFLLRLLYAVERMEENAIAEFFGFDSREMAFVMNEMIARDYVVHSDGQVWLTQTGRRLFTGAYGTPHIVSVDKRTDSFGFDLLSLCPQEPDRLDKFALTLPALPVVDAERAASATREVRQAFQQHFTEFDLLRRAGSSRQQYLYSVDNVSAEQKFLATVPVCVIAQGGRSTNVQVDLSEWRNGHELEDRESVVAAVAGVMEGIKQAPNAQDGWAYSQLLELAPEFLQEFTRRDGLAVDRYHKSAVARVGELRADRPTVPLVGSLFTPPNAERLLSAIKYAVKRLDALGEQEGHEASKEAVTWPDQLYWLAPAGHWGNTRALPKTLEAIRQAVRRESTEPGKALRTIGVRRQRERTTRRRLMDEAFSEIRFIDERAMQSSNLELLCIPGLVAAVLVHAPIKSTYGFPVPLGLISFDTAVVARTHEYFLNLYR